MANSANEPPAGAVPPSTEEAERLAERFRPSWEVAAEDAGSPPAATVAIPKAPPIPPGVFSETPSPPPVEAVAPLPPGITASVRPARASTPSTPPGEGTPAAPEAVPALPSDLVGTDAPPAAEEPSIFDAGVENPLPRAALKKTLIGFPTNRGEPGAAGSGAGGAVAAFAAAVAQTAEASPEAHPPVPAPTLRREKATLVGIGLTEDSPLRAAGAAQPITAEPQAENIAGLVQEPAPGPGDAVSVPLSEEPSKPTGFAKPYQPKDGPNTPAVVVEPGSLSAGGRRAGRSRSQQTPTIPGTLRALPGSASAAAALDSENLAEQKRSRVPQIAGLLFALFACAAAVALVTGASTGDPPAPVRVNEASPERPPAAAALESTRGPSVVPEAEPAETGPESTPANQAAPAEPAGSAAAPLSAPAATAEAAPSPSAPPAKAKAVVRRPAPAAAPARKSPVKRAATSATPAKGKPVIVRETPF